MSNVRDFLTDINIWGALLVSRCGDILNYSIPCLLKYCDKILLMEDNEDEKTHNIILDYQKKYPDRIIVVQTGLRRASPREETDRGGLHRRFKSMQGPIREKVFEYIREINKKEKVDILIWPDSDEMMSNSFPKLLVELWNNPAMEAIVFKPVDVWGDLKTICCDSMTAHCRVLKFSDKFTAIPYRTTCNYIGLTKGNRIGNRWVLLHLNELIGEKREWRRVHWTSNRKGDTPLWKLPKSVIEMTPEEIGIVLSRPPDLTIDDYLLGGEKRMPVGRENAAKALQEASELLKTMGIRHWLAFGTFLNIYRDGEIDRLSWDNDFMMDGRDLQKFDIKMATQSGFTEIKVKKDIPTYITDDKKSDKFCIRTISMKKYGVRTDIDIIYESKCGRFGLIPKGRVREQFVACFPIEWFKNDKFVSYRGKEYLILNNPEEYFKSNYGSTWNVPQNCVTSWDVRECRRNEYEINDELYNYNIKKDN